ncbi:hypothetical protein M885DRAFT_624346 [Pelagophyceae sp. CCMP2097]|nr:hypothetical protein M885DRAFT_624346 [Pelagophyceae sp. CCMP2097]
MPRRTYKDGDDDERLWSRDSVFGKTLIAALNSMVGEGALTDLEAIRILQQFDREFDMAMVASRPPRHEAHAYLVGSVTCRNAFEGWLYYAVDGFAIKQGLRRTADAQTALVVVHDGDAPTAKGKRKPPPAIKAAEAKGDRCAVPAVEAAAAARDEAARGPDTADARDEAARGPDTADAARQA